MAKLPTFERTSRRIAPARNRPYRSSRSAFEVCAGDQRQVEPLGDPSQLLEVLADDQHPVVGPVVPLEQQLDQVFLDRVLAGQAELVAPLGQGVFHPRVGGKPEPDLVALGLGDPAFRLEHAPGDVVLLGADQAEDVLLAVVLADQGGRQPEPAAGLDVGGDPEDGRRQQVDLVVDDQPPVALVEQAEVGEVAVLLGPVGDDLVGGQRDRPDLLGVAGVGGDLRLGSRSVLSRISRRHCSTAVVLVVSTRVSVCRAARAARPDDRLARAAGQDDHPRAPLDVAPGVKGVDGSLLVVADLERQARSASLAGG